MSDNQPQFALQRMYLKDVSFEAPNSPKVFTQQWQPEINLDLNTGAEKLDDQHFDVTLKATITAKNEGEVAFLIEIVQGGVFLISNVPDEQVEPTLGAMCPTILFPYMREAIDSLATKGGFPALMLAPINFEALYQQQKEAESTKH